MGVAGTTSTTSSTQFAQSSTLSPIILLIGIRDLSEKIDKGIAATDTKVGLLADDVALKIDSLTVDLKVETVRN